MSKERLEQLMQLLENDPTDTFLNYCLALEYVKINDRSKAIEIFKSIISKDQNYLAVYYQLGKLYENMNEPELAHEWYSKGIEIAKLTGNKKTERELKEAIQNLEE